MEAIVRTAQDIAAAGCYLHGKGVLHCCLSGSAVQLHAFNADKRNYIAKVGKDAAFKLQGVAFVPVLARLAV